jgi:DNA-binding PadR family transcriptional regulator
VGARTVSEQAFLVLTALVEEAKHGYAIVQSVETLSSGRVRLPVATLYGVLDRLVADGLVERDREEIHNGRLRRYYRLTDEGATALAMEAQRMAANARAATAALRARGFGAVPAGGVA